MQSTSAYFHVPFCLRRCKYCDFNTYAGMDSHIPAYVKALCHEIENFSKTIDDPLLIHTIYFGGGTPSLLTSDNYFSILATLKKNFPVPKDVEITMEVNPGTTSLEFLLSINNLGFNRLSIGMQSANERELAILGRIHNLKEVARTFQWARQAGFNNISLDLMFGIPTQTMESWKDSLKFAIELGPEHLSIYSLILETGTQLSNEITDGLLQNIDDDLSAEMYEWAMKTLVGHGFQQYEISNWAKLAKESNWQCKHNLQYWRNDPYMGFGAGAHSHFTHQRWENLPSILEYINEINRCLINQSHESTYQINKIEIDKQTEMEETMMLGMRLTDQGMNSQRFYNRFNLDMKQEFMKEILDLEKLNLVEWIGANKNSLRLTHRGILMGNQVFMRFIS